jgi:hypothetical protein
MKSKIRFVKGIHVLRNGGAGKELAIRANGLAEVNIRMTPLLVPRDYTEEPADGIYELDFTLEENLGEATRMEVEVEVAFHIKNMPAWVRGVRINACDNSDIELL